VIKNGNTQKMIPMFGYEHIYAAATKAMGQNK
jgi:hypothetical protein